MCTGLLALPGAVLGVYHVGGGYASVGLTGTGITSSV